MRWDKNIRLLLSFFLLPKWNFGVKCEAVTVELGCCHTVTTKVMYGCSSCSSSQQAQFHFGFNFKSAHTSANLRCLAICSLVHWHQIQHARLNSWVWNALTEGEDFISNKTAESLFSSPLGADQMLPAVTSLLGTNVFTMSIKKNGKQWERMDSSWHDQVEKDDYLHSNSRASSLRFMSLSITQQKKGSDRTGQNILSEVFLCSTSRMGEPKTNPQISDSTCFTMALRMFPEYSRVLSHHHHHPL